MTDIEGGSFVSSPVFSDTSGTRMSTIRWASRTLLVVVMLVGAALALTLGSHVPVPGLERFGPVPDSQELRPALRTVPSNAPSEHAAVKTGPASLQPQASAQPTTSQAGVPSADAGKPLETRRAVAPSTTTPTIGRSRGPNLRPTAGVPTRAAAPTASAGPTVGTVGQATVKTRNPKAATPSPSNEQAPGQSRTPKPKPTNGMG